MSIFSIPGRVTASAWCDDCGRVTIFVDQLTLRLGADTHDAFVRFGCPDCERITLQEVVRPELVDYLLKISAYAGIGIEKCNVSPDIFLEHNGLPFTQVDALKFAKVLEALPVAENR